MQLHNVDTYIKHRNRYIISFEHTSVPPTELILFTNTAIYFLIVINSLPRKVLTDMNHKNLQNLQSWPVEEKINNEYM